MKAMITILFMLAMVLPLPKPVGADIVCPASAVASGGISAGGTDFTIHGTIGQAVNGVMSGDPYNCDTGFRSQQDQLQFQDWANHNVGNFIFTVTDMGILGFVDGMQTEGSGFVYPAEGGSHLWLEASGSA